VGQRLLTLVWSLIEHGARSQGFVLRLCGSKVNLSGVNGNVIMSGWVDDNPDDDRQESDRDKRIDVHVVLDGSVEIF